MEEKQKTDPVNLQTKTYCSYRTHSGTEYRSKRHISAYQPNIFAPKMVKRRPLTPPSVGLPHPPHVTSKHLPLLLRCIAHSPGRRLPLQKYTIQHLPAAASSSMAQPVDHKCIRYGFWASRDPDLRRMRENVHIRVQCVTHVVIHSGFIVFRTLSRTCNIMSHFWDKIFLLFSIYFLLFPPPESLCLNCAVIMLGTRNGMLLSEGVQAKTSAKEHREELTRASASASTSSNSSLSNHSWFYAPFIMVLLSTFMVLTQCTRSCPFLFF